MTAAGAALELAPARPAAAPDAVDHARPHDRALALAVTGLFAVLVLVGVLRHEMWRDEMHAWMLARDSGSLGALFANTRYEGHPPLWHLLLFALSRLTRAPVAMQLLHAAIATATTYLIVRTAPFPRVVRAALPFSYFLLYEYALVSRGYALGVLLLFGLCALGPLRPRTLAPTALLLALLANTSIYGVMLAAAFGLAHAVDTLGRATRDTPTEERRRAWARLALLAIVGVLAAAVAVSRIAPPSTSTFRGSGVLDTGVWGQLVYVPVWVFRAYLPLPVMGAYPGMWRQMLPTAEATLPTLIAFSSAAAVLVGLAAAGLARRPAALLFYGASLGAHLLFTLLKFPGALYHHGHLFVGLVAAYWIAAWSAPPPPALRWLSAPVPTRAGDAGRRLLPVLLVPHVVAGVLLLVLDVQLPFSPGRSVATYLESRGLSQAPMIVTSAPSGELVTGYLDRPVFYAASMRPGTFVRWQDGVVHKLADAERVAVAHATAIAVRERRVALIVASRTLADTAVAPSVRLTRLAEFPPSMVRDERYVVYGVYPRDEVRAP